MNSVKPLLLTDVQRITVIKKGRESLIAEFPSWLCHYLGKEQSNIIGMPLDELTSLLPEEIKEFFERAFFFKQSIKGFKSSILDQKGEKHLLLFDSEILKNQPDNIVGFIHVQELPQADKNPSKLLENNFYGLVGMSDEMQRLFNKITMYAKSEASVLVTGETGTGKEGVAAAIHKISNRSSGPFITMNCSAITDTLFESELFGHEKGAFTGAIKNHKGRFERADNGSLFLDEIGDLPLLAQAKLLRALETSEIQKVGSEKNIQVSVRVVSATNKDLEKECFQKLFRTDLFYRINVLQIKIPPLRERTEDIELLINHFISVFNEKYNRNMVRLTSDAIALLKKYSWPGNVRELRNLMERIFAENQTEVVGLRAFQEWYEERVGIANSVSRDFKVPKRTHREAIPLGMSPNGFKSIAENNFEANSENETFISAEYSKHSPELKEVYAKNKRKSYTENDLKEAYKMSGGNITKASALLNIHKATFYRLLKNFNINRAQLEK